MTEELAGLIEHGAIPPFVYCYPTRSTYRPLASDWTVHKIWQADEAVTPTRDLNIYLHVPFCRYKCGFCNLYTVTSTDEALYDAYVDALCRELRRHASIIQARSMRTFYVGGGTPSLLSIRHFEQLFAVLDEVCFNWRPFVEEICIEATPDSIVGSPSTIEGLIDLGLTRVNMGVQSLDATELRQAGRGRAGASVVAEATAILKGLGLANLSTDLIMGFASQTDASWLRSVEALVDLSPDTISTYFLTVRPDGWFSKTGKYSYTRNPALYRRYAQAREIILGADYVQETNVRYKRLGRGGYRQKVLQFRGVPVLGIGVGARTYTNTVDYVIGGDDRPHVSQVRDFIADVRSGAPRIRGGFVYDDAERIRKRLALDLFDLDVATLERYQYSKHQHLFADVLQACVDLGLARRIGETRYQLTSDGYMYRDIISWLFFSDEVVRRDREFYEGLHRSNRLAVTRIGVDVPVSGLVTPAPESMPASGPLS